MTRLLPRTLFGRLVLVLSAGLIVAQLLSATVNLAERDRLLLRASGMQPAQRIADIVQVLDSMPAAERARIAAVLSVPGFAVTLDRSALPEASNDEGNWREAMFSAVLRNTLGEDRAMRLRIVPPDSRGDAATGEVPGAGWRGGNGAGMHPGMGMGMGLGMGRGAGGARRFGDAPSLLAQVQLRDGSWTTFDTSLSASAGPPWRLLTTLGVLLAAVLALSFVAVRWVTRPLHVLASAAEELGRDIHRAPVPEDGPVELRRAAQAFNGMQQRLVRVIDDRTRVLAAMSHDLKTPITRMRLRADLLEDSEQRDHFERDLMEMETMVAQALEFMRGVSRTTPHERVDVLALVESVQADQEAMGRDVTVSGTAPRPVLASAPLLKRCLTNLIDNAVKYGQRADVTVEQSDAATTIRVRDRGPGIPESALEQVFEPFFRLEGSRSRNTGGTGLGLSIAREIARAHGGALRIRNHPEGGAEAILELPVVAATRAITAQT